MVMDSTARLVTKSEYAELVGVSAGTVDRWLTERRLTPDWRTPGGYPRFYWPPIDARKDTHA